MKITVFDALKFEKKYLLEANKDRHEISFIETQLTRETARLAEGADAVIIFVNDDAGAEVLEMLHSMNIRYLALRMAGFNNVDLEKAEELGIKVANVPEYSPHAVAEHTVALMLALNRKLMRAHNRIRDLNFSLDGLIGFDMHGKTAGVAGTGKIGAEVAKILHGFGCKVLCYDIKENEGLINAIQPEYVSLEDLFSNSDIITLHTPLNKYTHYMVNEETISMMKDGVMLINTSRGGLVDTNAVIDGLKQGKIGYLGLDVYEEEEGLFFHDHSEDILQDDTLARLFSFQNVMVTSHQAFLTDTALKNISETTFENLNCWADGKDSPNEIKVSK
ncbi:MAG: 2-hydroxyacid dehydrogenase [Balneolales bacterium]|nr:2-hydroxyacid dehydrogenase [Balneolales bacterium]